MQCTMCCHNDVLCVQIYGDGIRPTRIVGEIMYGVLEPTSIGRFMLMRPSEAGVND
jgi:hypothetical protein